MPGLYAAGDVVDALDQISVASGDGAIAATHAHNWLQDGRMLQATSEYGLRICIRTTRNARSTDVLRGRKSLGSQSVASISRSN